MAISESSSSKKVATRRGAAKRAENPAELRPVSSVARPKKAVAKKEFLFKELPNPNQQPIPPYIWIDYPQEKETLLGPVYVIRLGVGGAEAVEISIDKGPWQACRLTSGYWWFDWKGISFGKHQLVARLLTSEGLIYRTPIRRCEAQP